VLDRKHLSRRTHFVLQALGALALLLLLAPLAQAYVGPGPGVEHTGYFVSLLVWAGVALAAFLLWPLYVLIRYFRRSKEKPDPALETRAEPASEEPVAEQESGAIPANPDAPAAP
jgi:hypothetical protein